LENKNKALPLHPQSRDEQHLERAAEVLRNNFLKKSFQKIWWFQKDALSLHPLSPLKRRRATKGLRKSFLKKVSRKFGGSKNLPYLCTTFPPQKLRARKWIKNGSLIYWF